MEKSKENLNLLKKVVRNRMEQKGYYSQREMELMEKSLHLGFYTGIFTEKPLDIVDGEEFAKMSVELF